jgi:hypothetical protein
MAPLTFDTGALIAAQRNERAIWRLWKESIERSEVPLVPAGALAQAWRGARSARLTQFLTRCELIPLDEVLSKAAGELLAASRTNDAIDASVVVTAARARAMIVTSDPSDMRRLTAYVEGVGVMDLRRAGRATK